MNTPNIQMKIVKVPKTKVDEMILKLYTRITLDKNKFDYVVGIERGGLNISIPLASMLNIPHKSIKISFYNKENKASTVPEVDFYGHQFDKKDKVLLVDDLIDGSYTVKYFRDNVQCNYKTAVLYWNKYNKNNIKADYYIEEKFINTWLTFYWEEEK
jgi:hypoxanthine phosphoribosyltransferase